MPETDIEICNRWIFNRLMSSSILVKGVGIHAQLGGPQFYFDSSEEGNETNIRIVLSARNAGQTTLIGTLAEGKFALIQPGIYYTNLGKIIQVSAESKLSNGTGTITVNPLASGVGAGEFINLTVPQIIYKYQTGKIRNGTGGRKIFGKPTYAIKAVCTGSSITPIAPLAAEIEKLFQVSQLDGDTAILGSHIVDQFIYPEKLDDGTKAWHMGCLVQMMPYNKIIPTN